MDSSPVPEAHNVSDVDSPLFQLQLTPIKRKLKHIDADVATANDDENEDDHKNFSINNDDDNEKKSLNDLLFQSQNLLLSQLSQGSQQNEQFTYHQMRFVHWSHEHKSTIKIKNNDLKENNSDIINLTKSFFLSLHNIKNNYELIIETIETAAIYFQFPDPCAISFLRKFIKFYPKLGSEMSVTKVHLDSYIEFIEHLFVNEFTEKFSSWNRSQMLSLFQIPNSTTPNQSIFMFDLIEYQIQCLEKINSNSSKEQTLNTINERNLFVSTHLFSVLVDFLQKDFENFLLHSFNYYKDISKDKPDEKPIWIQILWPKSNSKPEYMSRSVKYFIWLVARALNLYIKFDRKEYFYGLFYSSLFCLLSLTAECLRIGCANVRPYLQITSSRNLIAFELWCRLSQLKLTEDLNILRLVADSIEKHNLKWLNLQFCFQVLNNRFMDLKHILPTIIGANMSKIKISLRMIVSTFLTGDLDGFKMAYLKLFHQNRSHRPKITTPTKANINDKLRKTKNLLKKFSLENDRQQEQQKENIYQQYLNRKTNYGGNALHIACRQNDADAVMRFFESTQPNQADCYGYTPLIDAIRFEHIDCVRKLIEASKLCDIRLNYEAPVEKEKGYTPLHYAILTGNRDIIRLLLENGGQHLLTLESTEGQTPEDLIETLELKKFISEIQCKPIENYFPQFETLAKKYNVNVSKLVDFYCIMVKFVLSNYFETTKILQFDIDFYIDADDVEPDRDQLRNDLNEILFSQFNQIFQRSPSEQEINHLIDDLQVMINFSDYVEQFYLHLRKQNIDFKPNEFKQIIDDIESFKKLNIIRKIYL